MHFLVSAVLFAAFAAANAGVLIAPAVAPVAHRTVLASPVISPAIVTSPVVAKTVYAAPGTVYAGSALHAGDNLINGHVGTIHTKTVLAGSGLPHVPAVAVAYESPAVISSEQHIPPQVVHQY